MPDTRKHRSAAPEDPQAFAETRLDDLQRAVEHCSWLWSRGYARASALQLVGNRFGLTSRQRAAVSCCACPDAHVRSTDARRLDVTELRGEHLMIDAYNVLTTIEIAIGGGAVLLARDGCARDLASLHGTWRRVIETPVAIEAIGSFLEGAGPAARTWILDRPVSNSGRLAGFLRAAAEDAGWPWTVELETDADGVLIASEGVVASADREVLRDCGRWTSLARAVVTASVPDAWLVDLSVAR